MLRSLYENVADFIRGIRNVARWSSVIWFDDDYDWECAARIMEYKFRRMSAFFSAHGCHMDSEKCAREMLVCAELLKRLAEGNYYWRNGQKRFGDTTLAASHAMKQERYDQRYLGKVIGRHLNHWWD